MTPIYEQTIPDKQFATTLARGLEILRCFTPQEPVLGNKDLAERTGLPKATICRFTYTLTQLGYLRQADRQSKYSLGSTVLTLGYPFLATMSLRAFARPAMNDLADEVSGSVAMGIRERLNIVYVETTRSRARLAPPYTEIGFAHPIAATSIGRAYLAACTREVRTAILNEMKVKAPEQWGYKVAIERGIAEVTNRGFCVSYDQFRPGILGVAVPMRRPVGREIVVFNCAVYADRVAKGELESKIGPRLLALVQSIENTAIIS